jgi:hypothetical protein
MRVFGFASDRDNLGGRVGWAKAPKAPCPPHLAERANRSLAGFAFAQPTLQKESGVYFLREIGT